MPDGQLSKETDLIIHRNPHVRNFPIARFSIIDMEQLSAVIECKSCYEGPNNSEKEVKKHQPYVTRERIYLFYERVRHTMTTDEITDLKTLQNLQIFANWLTKETIR